MSKKNNIERWKWILIFVIGMIFWWSLISRKLSSTSEYINDFFSRLEKKYFRMEEISNLLWKEYYDKSILTGNEEIMIENATKAFVDWLGDPFTVYLDEEQYSWLQTELEWDDSIEWIGAVVWKKDYYIQVEEVVKNSPAYKAWIQPLDRIVMIGTWETKDLSTTEAVSQIRGPKWTVVDLFIERVDKTGQKEYLDILVTRDIIDVPSVRTKILEYDGNKLGYIEVSVFWDQTNKLFTNAISEIVQEKVEGGIIDLRGNGGWLLTSAVQLAWHFISKGETVVKTKYSVFEDIDYPSTGFWELEKMPTVVLVDGLTASSSEILTLALKELQWATVVWTQTFWKWSIQTLYDFKDGTSLKYTIGKIGVDGALYKSMEFTGEVIDVLDMAGRFTMCNMAIEAGGKNGIIAPDEKTMAFVNGRLKRSMEVLQSDKDAKYSQVVEINCSELEPQVSFPHLPENTKNVSEATGIEIQQAVIGSCTNGRIEDMRVAAEILKGRKVNPSVRCIVIPGTHDIHLQMTREGITEILLEAGACVSTPTCGPCLGGHMGVLAKGERAISTTNRNFVGRMGHTESEVYLASPAIAAASAVLGRIGSPEEL